MVALIPCSLTVVSYKATQTGQSDTVVLDKQILYML